MLATSFVAGVVFIALRLPPIADEPHHFAQIRLFLAGKWQMVPTLTTVPGYHAIVAIIGYPFHAESIVGLRLCTLVISAAALLSVYTSARLSTDGYAVERLLQIAFLPILFPLLFVLYTDVGALLLFLLSLQALQRDRYSWAASAATATVLLRQNYIAWVVFLAVFAAARTMQGEQDVGQERGLTFRWPEQLLNRDTFRKLAFNEAGFLLLAAGYAAFLFVNGGVAIGDRTMHPFPSFHLGNVYFALFLSFVVLLPLHILNAPAILRLARRPAVIGALAAMLPVFFLTFHASHPYNGPELNWWLHNRILNDLTSTAAMRAVMFAASAVAFLSFAVTSLGNGMHVLVYPFAVLTLIPSWQIEPRYYLCALVLVLLLRRPHSRRFERLFIAYLATVSAALTAGVASHTLFL